MVAGKFRPDVQYNVITSIGIIKSSDFCEPQYLSDPAPRPQGRRLDQVPCENDPCRDVGARSSRRHGAPAEPDGRIPASAVLTRIESSRSRACPAAQLRLHVWFAGTQCSN